MAPQTEFDFDQPGPGDGLEIWRQQRERTLHRLARRLGLPLGRQVEVWLKDGVKLRGRLDLKDSMLLPDTVDEHNLQLAVDQVTFRYAEIESCVRQD